MNSDSFIFLNHLYDEKLEAAKAGAIAGFLNHLCDEQMFLMFYNWFNIF